MRLLLAMPFSMQRRAWSSFSSPWPLGRPERPSHAPNLQNIFAQDFLSGSMICLSIEVVAKRQLSHSKQPLTSAVVHANKISATVIIASRAMHWCTYQQASSQNCTGSNEKSLRGNFRSFVMRIFDT